MTLTLIQDDTAPTLTGIVSADLTGASAQLHIRRPDGTVITKTATITDAANGAWSAPWAVGDLTPSGRGWRVEIQVTYSTGLVQTFATDLDGDLIEFNVRAQIA